MKRLIKALASPLFMASLLILLIITLATATFIENDFGAQIARYKVYNAWWFEVVLVLLAINLLLRVFTLKLYKPAKFSVFLFHIAFVFMLIGAGITRYYGEEGSMHIREGQASNRIQTVEMNNGSREIKLPFSIYLNDFVIDRYPGSMSPSSYSSHVTVLENGEKPMPYHIYMNNILKYKGFRFFQSSYDNDEQGSILSVNHDPIGTGVTYFSYFLLALGIVWSLINPNTFFRRTTVKVKTLIVMALVTGGTLVATPAQAQNTNYTAVDKEHAEEFGSLLIQNNRGRTEPVYSFASDLMRKIARKNSIDGLTPAQLFLDMNRRPDYWATQPIIRVSNGKLQETLGISSKYVAYSDFFRQNSYVMQKLVQMAYAKPRASRSKYDKAIIKTDEKVNICYGIFSGKYLKIFPTPGSSDSTVWYYAEKAAQLTQDKNNSTFLSNILPAYYNEIANANQSNNYTSANKYLKGIEKFQRENAGYELPSSSKVQIEILYIKHNPFKTLFPYYLALGVIYLIVLLVLISTGKEVPRWLKYTFYYALLAGFIVHTVGYAARWYISGYAPMSNGYESMVFISWVTILAGYLFNKKSAFTLTATAVLGGLTLMVANLSFMDPQITNLVPVLQSYWLTIHVSVITAGYGFLALGAILGLLNMLLIILSNKKNSENISGTYTELTVINHKTLIAGLYLLTIGTFLGAVWANESWGRYWGWDPKETWALISIIVYTIVTHARKIPGMRSHFVFNVLSLWGFSSIIMTYFGVNYYLSGLHSYAGGDSIPVPTFVYYTVAGFIALTVWASVKNEKIQPK
jgi:cytochrome c-type biogenesis protein CcsB